MLKPGLTLFLAILISFGASASLLAHPMGNTTINHYSKVHVSAASLSVHTVIDFAEIPTFQLFSQLGIRKDINAGSAELQGKLEKLVRERKRNFSLLLDGSPVWLQVSNIKYSLTRGTGALPTLRISFDLTAPWTPGPALMEFFDKTYPQRAGWKEMVVAADPGFTFPDGNPFGTDRSAGLVRYPADPLASAPSASMLSIRVTPSVDVPTTATNEGAPGNGRRWQ